MRLLKPLRQAADGSIGAWADPWINDAITRWFMPLSRGYAAARMASGSVARFRSLLPDADVGPETLMRVAEADGAYGRAEAIWQEAAFDEAPAAAFARVTARRDRAARRLMLTRLHFLPAVARGKVPPVAWNIADCASVEAAHGARLANPGTAFLLPERAPPVQKSAALIRGAVREYWLRSPGPVPGGPPAWARVVEPRRVAGPVPTVILLHGIGVEAEMWADPHGAMTKYLVQHGLRVIRPELPGHGRRCAVGFYGGEEILARAPLATLDFFRQTAVEAARWIAWAREAGSPHVAIGGVSLGALASSLVARVADAWEPGSRPDALFLGSPTGDMVKLVHESSLTRPIGMPERLLAQGWTPEVLTRWLPLITPDRPPQLPADRIVAALGDADELTHFEPGLRLLRAWGLPDSNLAVMRKGHFTLNFSLTLDTRALDRLVEVLR
ncbi:MAG: alpha/beta hydrolase [Ferrovibrionaceae bacterium]